jgi:hypothetical protein
MQIFDRIRGQDIRLLKLFKVGFIFDLMLEQKKVKFGMKLVLVLFVFFMLFRLFQFISEGSLLL